MQIIQQMSGSQTIYLLL